MVDIQLDSKLAAISATSELVQGISTFVREKFGDNRNAIRGSVSLIREFCNVLETLDKDQATQMKGGVKRDVVLKAYLASFDGVTDIEQIHVGTICDFLYDNGMITPRTRLSKILACIARIFR